MHRFFLPGVTGEVGSTLDLAPLHHQLTRVLRATLGTQLLVLDNQGQARQVELIALDKRHAQGRVLAVMAAPAEPAVQLTLYQCALKADKLEWVWQKSVELGASCLVPVVSQRTVVRPVAALEGKRARWEAIVREAAEQSHRGQIPRLGAACDLSDALAAAQGVRLIAWEGAQAQPSLLQALRLVENPMRQVNLLIGPEGGFAAAEVAQAQAAGWQSVSLGQRILRAETAALVAVTLVMGALGEMGTGAG